MDTEDSAAGGRRLGGGLRYRRPFVWPSGGYEIDLGRLSCLCGAIGAAAVEHGRDVEPVSLMWREVAREFILERGRGLLVVAGVRALQRKVQGVVPAAQAIEGMILSISAQHALQCMRSNSASAFCRRRSGSDSAAPGFPRSRPMRSCA